MLIFVSKLVILRTESSVNQKYKLHLSLICNFYCCFVKEGLALKNTEQLDIRGLVAYKPVTYNTK